MLLYYTTLCCSCLSFQNITRLPDFIISRKIMWKLITPKNVTISIHFIQYHTIPYLIMSYRVLYCLHIVLYLAFGCPQGGLGPSRFRLKWKAPTLDDPRLAEWNRKGLSPHHKKMERYLTWLQAVETLPKTLNARPQCLAPDVTSQAFQKKALQEWFRIKSYKIQHCVLK